MIIVLIESRTYRFFGTATDADDPKSAKKRWRSLQCSSDHFVSAQRGGPISIESAKHDVVPTRSTTGQHDCQSIGVPQTCQQGLECSGQALSLKIESSSVRSTSLFPQRATSTSTPWTTWKKYSAFVGNTEHFRQEDRLGRLRGLGKYESRQRQASANLFVYPEGHGVIVLGSQFSQKAR